MYLKVHESIRVNVYVVFVPDLLGKIGWVDAQVLIIGHVSAEVEIVDVNTKVAGASVCVINSAVVVQFGIGH